jgi:DNA-binding HxlR family transcriptional regulator
MDDARSKVTGERLVHNLDLPPFAADPTFKAMTTYGQFCPVALGAEIFAERWTPLILRELLMGGKRFSDIHRGVPRISKNLLTQRLHALQGSAIIEQRPTQDGHQEYHLTTGGRELGAVIEALGTWGYRWACKDLSDEDLDPDFLMWTLRRMVRVDALPDQRAVLLFRFRGYRDRFYWLVLQRPEVDLCMFDPGYELSLEIDATVEALARVCLGQVALLQAMRDGAVEVHGAPRYRNALPSWLGVTHFAATAKTASPASL